jgi:5-methylcytosine-specific restriction endonuclease McrA
MPYKDIQNQKNWYIANKERIIMKSRKRYKEKIEEIKVKQRKYYLKHRKLTGEGSGHKKGKMFEKGHIPWNKGLDNYSEKHKQRSSVEYRKWRKICLLRDNFTCRITGENGGKLVVHHINNFADFPELRFNINNGITMKKEIHKLFHKIYGKKNNTKEQIEKFAEDLFFNPSNDYIIHS